MTNNTLAEIEKLFSHIRTASGKQQAALITTSATYEKILKAACEAGKAWSQHPPYDVVHIVADASDDLSNQIIAIAYNNDETMQSLDALPVVQCAESSFTSDDELQVDDRSSRCIDEFLSCFKKRP